MEILSKPIRVMLVDDDRTEFILTRQHLRQITDVEYQITWVSSYEAALEAVVRKEHDVYLVDQNLGNGESGVDLIHKARKAGVEAPMIMLTGAGERKVDLEAMQAGATDFIEKSNDATGLERSIRFALERERLQKRLKAETKRQIELKHEFLSHISHELRSPLHAIYQFVSLVADGDGGPVNETQKEYLTLGLKNVNHLCEMIDDLLDSTRIENGKLSVEKRPMNLKEVIEQAVRSRDPERLEKKQKLEMRIAKDLPTVTADPVRVHQIVTNLVQNAIKFTPQGGSISVGAGCNEDHKFVEVKVRDTGRGIQNQELNKVFRRHYQVRSSDPASRKGLGLGLHICKELVATHGGEIWVESQEGEGSTFTFTLPVFSLARLLRPILMLDGRPRREVTLLIVECSSQALGLHVGAAQEEIRAVVQECTLPDLDVVLPPGTCSERDNKVYIVVGANQAGAEVAAQRMQKQLKLSAILRSIGAETTTRTLEIWNKQDGQNLDAERQLELMTSRVIETIRRLETP